MTREGPPPTHPPQPRTVAHPDAYTWLVLLGALDVVCTRIVLQVGGVELNPIAARMISLAGHWGLIALKFTMMALVIVICEHLARRRPALSRRVAVGAVAVSAAPVVIALMLLARHAARA
jgi:hypothetical protein